MSSPLNTGHRYPCSIRYDKWNTFSLEQFMKNVSHEQCSLIIHCAPYLQNNDNNGTRSFPMLHPVTSCKVGVGENSKHTQAGRPYASRSGRMKRSLRLPLSCAAPLLVSLYMLVISPISPKDPSSTGPIPHCALPSSLNLPLIYVDRVLSLYV